MNVRESAPAKVNLVLHVGPRGADGLHELCSLFASLDLADELMVEEGSGADEVICPGVDGENIAARALAAFRAAAPDADLPPLRVTIDKRVPVAAGMGGGSADAAAVLRAANELAGEALADEDLGRLAIGLGSDVPSQLRPADALVTGAGEGVEPVRLPPLALVLVPHGRGLSTGAVFAELDGLRSEGAVPARDALDPEPLRALGSRAPDEIAWALENDLEPAALSLRPELGDRLDALRREGALGVRITGSGPTAFGVFTDRASAAAAAAKIPGALVAGAGG